jgi:hypothetical protein
MYAGRTRSAFTPRLRADLTAKFRTLETPECLFEYVDGTGKSPAALPVRVSAKQTSGRGSLDVRPCPSPFPQPQFAIACSQLSPRPHKPAG